MTSAVAWEPEAINLSVNEALELVDADERSAVDDAKEFLETLLIDGPCTVSKIQEEAKNAGYSGATVRRAKRSLGIKPKKQGMKGPWAWQLPAKMLTGPEDTHPTDVNTFAVDEHLREPDDDLQQTITDLLSRHPKGLSNEEIAVILKVPLIKVEAVRGDHG